MWGFPCMKFGGFSLSSSLDISSSSSAWSWFMSWSHPPSLWPEPCHIVLFQFLTRPSQSGSGLVFHSSRSLAPSSLLTAAHSGDMFVVVSLGGSCCLRGFFLGDGSIVGVGVGGGCSSPDSGGREDVADIVDEPLESGRGGEPGDVSNCVPFIGVTSPSGRFLSIDGLGDPGTVFSWSTCDVAPEPGGSIGVILAGVIVAGPWC